MSDKNDKPVEVAKPDEKTPQETKPKTDDKPKPNNGNKVILVLKLVGSNLWLIHLIKTANYTLFLWLNYLVLKFQFMSFF